MATLDPITLFNVTTRHALYVEGVKIGMYRDFQAMLTELSKELDALFGRLEYRTLDVLNKSQLNKLLVQLRRVQNRIYGTYANALVKQIEAFMNADLRVTKRQYASLLGPYEDDASEDDANEFLPLFVSQNRMSPIFGVAALTTDPAKLWANLRNLPMPANGVTFPNFISAFSASAQGGIENIVRQAWANGLSVEQLVAILKGNPGGGLGGVRQGSSSQIDRIHTQGTAVIQTVTQFVATGVAAGVASAFFSSYMWNSIIDSRTTDICRNRNGHIYPFSTGPRPPAHIRCRSHITPLPTPTAPVMASSLGTWLADQPEVVRKDLAGDFPNGEYRPQPLTLAQFERKLRYLLAR